MTQQRKGGLGRGLAALIPTSPEQNPHLGDSAADVILGPRDNGPRTTPPRPGHPRASDDDEHGAPVDLAPTAGSHKKNGKLAKKATPVDPRPMPDRVPKRLEVSRETFADEQSRGDSNGDHTIDDSELVDPGAVYREVPVAQIEPNPKQPRTVFDEEALAELAHSVREFGLLQPIVVRELDDGRYQLIMGERRWRASQRAELHTIPAIVRQTDDEELLRDALLENIHRVQLNPLEEAAAYQQLLEEFGVTQAELAQRIGRSRPAITNSIRLLQLPTPVQRRVAAGVLSAGHARALLGLESGLVTQEELAARIVAEGLSVRATEELVTLANRESGNTQPDEKKKTPAVRKPEWDSYAATLADRLDTTVTVTMGKRKGRITIDVGNDEDLRRVVAILGGHPE